MIHAFCAMWFAEFGRLKVLWFRKDLGRRAKRRTLSRNVNALSIASRLMTLLVKNWELVLEELLLH